MNGIACHDTCPGHPWSMCHLKQGHKTRHYAILRGPGRPRARWNTGEAKAEIVAGYLMGGK